MSNKIRALVIGCGGFCRYNISSLANHPDFEIVAVVDPLEASRLEVAKMAKLSKYQAFPTDAEAFEKSSPEMAFIFSPVEAHYGNCRIALENGCCVSVAKPLAASLDQALDLIKLSKKTQRWVSVGQTARLGTFSQIVKKLLNEGTIGKPTFGNFHTYRNRMQDLKEYSRHERWPVINATTIHQFDQYRYIFEDEIRRVCFRGIDVPWNPYDDPGVITGWLEMESGFVFSFFKSFISRVVLDSKHHPYEHGMIQGDRGAVFWKGPWGKGPIRIHRSGASRVECLSQKEDYQTTAKKPLDLLRDSLREGKEVFCPAEDNIRSLAAIKAAELSAAQGGIVVDVLEFGRLSGLSKFSDSRT